MYLSTINGLELAQAPVSTEYDGVFEGGGPKGLAFAGALAFMESQGMWFKRVVGTSAGAITAALIAAGYRSKELEKIMNETDFNTFKDSPDPGQFQDDEITKSLLFKIIFTFLTSPSPIPSSVSPAVSAPINAARAAFRTLPSSAWTSLFKAIVLRIPAVGPVPSMSSIFFVIFVRQYCREMPTPLYPLAAKQVSRIALIVEIPCSKRTWSAGLSPHYS